MKDFASEIYAAVKAKRLAEPFDADAVKRACPGWADRTYHVFLAKHAVGNPGENTELFVRVTPGRYRTCPGLSRFWLSLRDPAQLLLNRFLSSSTSSSRTVSIYDKPAMLPIGWLDLLALASHRFIDARVRAVSSSAAKPSKINVS